MSIQYRSWLAETVAIFQSQGISSARLDALVLLEHITGSERSILLAHDDNELTPEERTQADQLVKRRAQHEPIAYILGQKEFYGRMFSVNSTVLVPRPESEDIISLLLELPAAQTIIDIGTGSGALAITAKLELSHAVVYGTDNDVACLHVAAQNAKALSADVRLVQSDLLDRLESAQLHDAVLLANLPYVPSDYPINQDATHEPAKAIFSAEHGLSHYRRLFEQLAEQPVRPVAIICESLEAQHDNLRQLAAKHGFTLRTTKGLQQLFSPDD